MEPQKAERPALAQAMKRAAEIVHLGRTNGFEANPTLSKFQAEHLARRFWLAPHVAAIVAGLAFGEARS